MSNMRLGSSGGSRRLTPDGQAIEMESAISLKLLLLGSATKVYPDGWLGQSFTFQKKQLKFGLVQRRGGPCGVLAVVQSFILKQLIFNDQEMVIGLNIPSTEQCQSALVDALTHILLQVKIRNLLI